MSLSNYPEHDATNNDLKSRIMSVVTKWSVKKTVVTGHCRNADYVYTNSFPLFKVSLSDNTNKRLILLNPHHKLCSLLGYENQWVTPCHSENGDRRFFRNAVTHNNKITWCQNQWFHCLDYHRLWKPQISFTSRSSPYNNNSSKNLTSPTTNTKHVRLALFKVQEECLMS